MSSSFDPVSEDAPRLPPPADEEAIADEPNSLLEEGDAATAAAIDIADADADAAPAPAAVAQAPPAVEPPSDMVLFERAPSRSPGMHGSYAATPYAPPAGEPGSSLFDRYASAGVGRSFARNSQTLTSKLRSTGIKLSCYLNTESNRGRSYTVHLPEACDTLGEVFALVQRKMQLDSRMLYAAELYLPDGTKVKTYTQLAEASQLDTPIIVGCGEPFDHSTVPQAMLSFHMHGGGRAAAKLVKKEIAEKKIRAAQLKADQVRASGHGLSSAAAASAKAASVEANKQSASVMRHDYMNQLIARSAQQNELIRHVQANNAMRRSERARREAAQKSVWDKDRLHELAESRRREASVWREKQEAEELKTAKRVDYAKRVRLAAQAEGKLAKTQLSEQRKAAGLERRMSYISRSVEKAAQEQDLIKTHQIKKAERKGALLGLRSPMSSQAGSAQVSQRSAFG